MEPVEVAVAAAREAGAILLEHLHAPLEIEEKGRRADLVTQADRASETAIVSRLRSEYPSATILAEEGGERKGVSQERWIADPLDGTTNFAHAYPLFCISIAYERNGELLAGVIYAPLMDELFVAQSGAGALRNGVPVTVSSIGRLADAMVCTGFKPYDYQTNAPYFAKASNAAQAVRRDGSAALDLAYTAMGRFDAFWEFDLAPWDTAAGVLLVREAGGTVTALDGSPYGLGSRTVLASNGAIHSELSQMLHS